MISRRINSYRVSSIVEGIRQKTSKKVHVEIVPLNGLYLANVFLDKSDKTISDSTFTGVGAQPELALCKALVEMVERSAFKEGAFRGDPSCNTQRSDGFAAYPMTWNIPFYARKVAKENAYNEAVERFGWATWWDDSSLGFDSSTYDISNVDMDPFGLGSLDISRIVLVKPLLSSPKSELQIFIAFLEGGGVVSGGAAGKPQSWKITRVRALSELTRHILAVKKLQNTAPTDFYEKRLRFFASHDGQKLVEDRLLCVGEEKIRLPPLCVDSGVNHSLDKHVYVHRCLFQDQPAFIGGHLERFCI